MFSLIFFQALSKVNSLPYMVTIYFPILEYSLGNE